MRESGGKRRMAGVAEKRVALAAKEATRNNGIHRCEGLSVRGYSRRSERPRCVAILVSAKQNAV